jgi:uncharacterized protein (TIGR02611 family)
MRIVRIVAGGALLVAGVVMLALPGPGWLTIAGGLTLLAGEFVWARRLLDRLKDTSSWLGRRVRHAGNDDGAEASEHSGPGRR